MKPLQGITILDISRLLPGGFASLLLARLGARVIKVEQPGIGDYYRALSGGKEFVELGHFRELHEGKEFLTLNLKSPEGRKIFEKLVRRSDLVLENFRPGVMDQLGFSYAKLCRFNRKIILCSITGSGQRGPRRRLGGHDLNYLALSGLLSLIGDSQGRPVTPDFQITDLVCGYRAVLRILAALLARQKTGRGEWIDVSLESSGLEMANLYRVSDRIHRADHPLKRLPNYQVYRTRDHRDIVFAALEPKFIENFSRAVGKRALRQWNLKGLAEIFRQKRLREWVRLERLYDFCLSPVLTVSEALGRSSRQKLPPMGRDNRKILKSLGWASARIERLKALGVL